MVEPKSRKTGEHNGNIIKLMADAVAMRAQIDGLEARLLRLEAELATLRTTAEPSTKAPPRASLPVSADSLRPGKRGGAGGPPPLPRITGSMGAVGGRRSFVDISDIAELVESMPPPAPRSKK